MKKINVDLGILKEDKKVITDMTNSINDIVKELKSLLNNHDLKPAAFYDFFNDGEGVYHEDNSLEWLKRNDMPNCLNKIQGIGEKINKYIDEIERVDSLGKYETSTTNTTYQIVGTIENSDGNYELTGETLQKLPYLVSLDALFGTYRIISDTEENGVRVVVIEKDGKRKRIYVDANGNIIKIEELDVHSDIINTTIIEPSNTSKKADVYFNNDEINLLNAVAAILLNGNIMNIPKGTYKVISDKEENGIRVVEIEKDGKRIKLYIDKDGKIIKAIELDKEKSVYNLTTEVEVPLSDGTTLLLTPGAYIIISDKEENGVRVVEIEKDGKRIKLYIDKDGRIIKVYEIEEKHKTFELKDEITIILPNGQPLTINRGAYQIIDEYTIDGVRVVKIKVGDIILVLYYDEQDNIKNIEYIMKKEGIFTIINNEYDVYNSRGEKIKTLSYGEYIIYEVKYDKTGNVKEIRISPHGEYELWIYVTDADKNNYQFFNEKIETNNGSIVSMFEKDKGLFGLLGVLIVGLGVTLAVKRKLKKKGESEEDYEEEPLPQGQYDIYEVKKNKDGIITDARITPDEYQEEYWVEL